MLRALGELGPCLPLALSSTDFHVWPCPARFSGFPFLIYKMRCRQDLSRGFYPIVREQLEEAHKSQALCRDFLRVRNS